MKLISFINSQLPNKVHFSANFDRTIYNLQRQKVLYGENIIDIRAKSTMGLLLDQIVHPFNVFQALSVIIWMCEEYELYACCILLITSFSLAMTIHETKSSSKRIQRLVRHSQQISIYRNGKCNSCLLNVSVVIITEF